ncbi:MAG: YigZ family protein [Bacteroidales bacterium]|nr:YigZ family protein [Candidatus Physcousia equi]
MTDTYLSIAAPAEAEYSEKRSKFLAFAFPVKTTEEVKVLVDRYEKEYYDARHVCYAYMLGAERKLFRAVDNGEPSGTAGRPILGQINSAGLTDVLIIVVRYFGGIKLGTSGLTQAYKTAAAAAIEHAKVEEYTVDALVNVSFEYTLMNSIMRIVKEEEPQVLGQSFDNNCILHLKMRKGLVPKILERFATVRGATTEVLDENY